MEIEKITTELKKCKSFKEFFIKVSELKLGLNREELKVMNRILDIFSLSYGSEAIVYLKDTIFCEMALNSKNQNIKKSKTEKDYQKELVENFENFFPDFKLIKEEFLINGYRIDILSSCKKTNKKVIMELKLKSSNPSRQLRHYDILLGGGNILISISETEVKNKEKGIIYKTFDSLKF